MAYDSLASLAKTIEEFLNLYQNSFSVRGYREIQSIHYHATSLLALLHDSPKKTISSERRVRELANEAEDTIHFFMLENIGSYGGSIKSSVGKLKRQLRKVAEEMNSIVGEMEMKDSVTIQGPRRLTESTFSAANEVVVGFDNDLMRLQDSLLNGSKNLQILSIVGPGGIGKTTLARCVYNDPLIMNHFPIRVWLTVSPGYSPTDILSSLLVSLGLQNEQKPANIIYTMVRQRLYEKRYLVVVDDVLSTTEKVWNNVRNMFPDDCNGSRIMLTTRQLDVATYMSPDSTPHQMNLMDDDQSWYLLWNRVFGEQGCPHEFELIGRKIARGCGGLPLSIVIMADLLSSIPMTLHSWEAIAEDVISAISTKDGRLEKMISSSFMELPHHLRLCLLYMGGFPKDYEFRVSQLIKLWVAEGFVKRNVSQTFEEVAEDYLNDLANRSLVLIASRKYNGKITSCSLHDVTRDFCIRKVQEGKFLLPVMDYLPHTTLRRYFLPKILKNQRRVILNSYDLHLRETIHNSPMRTIICIQQEEYLPTGSVQIFPLLRILHVINKSDNLGWESDHVFELIHLRYLAANIPSTSIPAAISKLHNLQTLIIYKHNVHLPEEIWRLTKLRHLIAFSFLPLPHPQLPTSPLLSLQTLSLVSNFDCSEMILKLIPNLKKLGICYSEDTSDQDYHLNNLTNLHQLETLKLEVHKDFSFGRGLNHVFPLTLKKLSLSGCRLPWKDMTIVGSLPYLEVLKLSDFAFQGDHWKTREGEFCCLKYLRIDESDLQCWDTKYHHFYELVCLVLYRCPYLQKIPHDIGFVPRLELLEVDNRNESLVESAETILKYQHDSGNKSVRVQVKHF